MHPDLPAGRYDTRRAANPLLVWIAATVVAALVVGGAYLFFAQHEKGTVDGALRTYDVKSDKLVTVTIEVRTGSGTARCGIRAKDRDGLETGYAVISVPRATGSTSVVSYDLPTQKRAVTAELLGCHRS